MNILGRKPSLSSLSARSNQIFSTFTKMKTEATALNSEINKLSDEKKKEAQNLLDEAAELERIALKNQNLADKIDAFINN